MPASITDPADVVNMALIRIGYKKTIGNLYDGSIAAQAALQIYGQTRDEVLGLFDWDSARLTTALTILKRAPDYGYIPPTVWGPQYPPLPYRFEYNYPENCLKVRLVRPPAIFVANFDPAYNSFEVATDAPANAPTAFARVILSNISDAICVYTGRVTNPALWNVDLVEAIASAIGQRLAPMLVGLDPTKLAAQDAIASKSMAEQIQG